MDQYEVIIRATVAIETAKDASDAAEQAIQKLDAAPGTCIVNISVWDIRKVDD